MRESEWKGCKVKDTKSFIDKSVWVWLGEEWDYSKVNYVNNYTKVIIICKTHGDFLCSPDKHLSGRGCPKCSKSYPLTTKSFIERSKEVHGDTYDYSKTRYVKSNKKVRVECKRHGPIYITPAKHIQGQGCLKCWYEKLTWRVSEEDYNKPYKVYFIKIFKTSEEEFYFYKVGVTRLEIINRFSNLKSIGYNFKVVSMYESNGRDCQMFEDEIMDYLRSIGSYRKCQILKENNVSGWTECFQGDIIANEVEMKFKEKEGLCGI